MKRILIAIMAILPLFLAGCKDHIIKEETLPEGAINFAYEVINDTVYNLDYYAGCTVRFYPTVALTTDCDWQISDGRSFTGVDTLVCKFPVAGNFTVTATANGGKKTNPIEIADIRPIVRIVQTDSVCVVDSSYISFDVELPNPDNLEAVYQWTFPGVKDEAGQELSVFEGQDPGKIRFTKSGSQPIKLQVLLGGRALDLVTRNVQVALKDPVPTLYYAVKEGNIMARKLTSVTGAEPYNMGVASGEHPFNLLFAESSLYILDAGKQFNYVNDENGVLGDGQITVMAADASTFSTVISNVGGPAFQDPFYGCIEGGKLYYSDRNTGIFSIPLSTRNQVWSKDAYPYFVQNAQLGYYSRGLSYGAITGCFGKVEGTWYWAKTFNGNGIWRFVDADILPDANSYEKATAPTAGSILTSFYTKAFVYDAQRKMFYFSLYDMAAGVYGLPYEKVMDADFMKSLASASDLAPYQLGDIAITPIVEKGKGEGSDGEYIGICQMAVDEATGDVYFAYRAADKTQSGLYRYDAAAKTLSLIADTQGTDIYGVAINQQPTQLF